MTSVRVVSWNVGRLYTPTNNNRLEGAAIPHVAAVLAELEPDVVLLQEVVDAGQLRLLERRLAGHVGAIAERCRYDRHVAVLVRRALEPVFEQHVLEPTGRGTVAATFALPSGSGRGVAWPLHFDVFDTGRRRSQAEAILELTGARPEPLVVAGGDLNLDPRLARGLRRPVDVGTFERLERVFGDAGRSAGPTLVGLLRVDHVFARGRSLLRTVTRVQRARRVRRGDHDPVVCDLELSVAVDAAHATP